MGSDAGSADADAGADASAADVGDEDTGPPTVPLAARIASVPGGVAVVGAPWSYPVIPFPAGAVTVELTAGPTGMALDAGVLRWTPTAGQVGDAEVAVRAEVAGTTVEQAFRVRVVSAAATTGGTIGSVGGTVPFSGGGALVVPSGALAQATQLAAW